MRYLSILILALSIFTAQAQVPTPAKDQTNTIAITGATIHVGDGQVFENGTIVFANGKITSVGSNVQAPAGATVVDATGKHVYPGLIAPATYLGLSEIDAIRPTRDNREVGSYNPNARSIIAYSTDSRVTPTIRSNGILLAEIAPIGGRISGTSSVVELDAWNWEDAAYATDMGMHINWPSMYRHTGWWAEPGPILPNEGYQGQFDELVNYFKEAQAYAKLDKVEEVNMKFEAMKGLFTGTKKVFVHVDGAKEILAVIDFKKQFGLDLAIVGGTDSWRVADALAENKVPVVLRNVHALPETDESDVDLPYKLPALLNEAGVEYCLSIYGGWEQRNLMFMAGTAATYGLTKEEALSAITYNTAKILGIDKNVGTLTTGKDATLIISTGDVLDMRTSNIEQAFIRGKQIDLNNKQKELYQKFDKKYKEQ